MYRQTVKGITLHRIKNWLLQQKEAQYSVFFLSWSSSIHLCELLDAEELTRAAERRSSRAWAMVLYATSQDCSGGAGFVRGAASGVAVALRAGNGSDVAQQGLWCYVCCQRRPTLTQPSCRYTCRDGSRGCFTVCLSARNYILLSCGQKICVLLLFFKCLYVIPLC